ncbi:MAG: histidine kinase [Acidimicrobiia bacterium]
MTRIDDPIELTSLRDPQAPPAVERIRTRSTAPVRAGAVLVLLTAVLAASEATNARLGPGRLVLLGVTAAWCVGALAVSILRPHEPLAGLMTLVGGALALAMLGSAELAAHPTYDGTALVRAFGVGALPAVGAHLVLGLPEGRLEDRTRRRSALAVDLLAVGYVGWSFAARPELPTAGLIALSAVALVVALVGYVARCRRARTQAARARLQWPAWGALTAAGAVVACIVLHALVEWPTELLAITVGATALLPCALAIGAHRSLAVRIDRLLVHTITIGGLLALVAAVALAVVAALGRSLDGGERGVLGLSIAGAAIAALLWVPARARLQEYANRRVYGEQHAPDEVIRTFGSRLTRALPLDELLLQLAESLKKTMDLERAEVWTRAGGVLEREVSVPDRGHDQIPITSEEEVVVARAGVSGPAWIRVWLPALLTASDPEADPPIRVAPVTNSGELLGVIVVRRAFGDTAFTEDDDQALTELARQVGLALHNLKLDSALQDSLDEVRRHADELRRSRARIVEATDRERRRIERDLHDGAQQHLVALAVSTRLARQLADADPEATKEMLDQIAADLQEAVQELRNLAHGIYPPLLMDRGLPDALRAAGDRCPLATEIDAEGVGRYPQQVEAAIYFCCLEALQNAGKHAGPDARITIDVREEHGALLFSVTDTGAGFDLAGGQAQGHGFVNMADRVGAFGGSLTVESSVGAGTSISGRVPLDDA